MNFLGHLYLSRRHSDEIIIGNFIADGVRGKELKGLPPTVFQGIKLHRSIDDFTDKNFWVKKSKQRLYSEYGKYSPVIVDIYYDHFLAISWEKYSPEISLKDFAQASYDLLESYPQYLTNNVKFLLTHMRNQNWLYNYSEIESLEKTFEGMSRRATFKSKMETACNALVKDYEFYKEEFAAFFPEIIRFVEEMEVQE
ncbi:ACP phosphodiesterase [Sporocytophaga myxococcoides]|uniref:acyl carrier protein phosphodiesterase n=1 Tax=Sporocytophaga myxococcoides TaxID=153721 RepID=UPI00041DF5C9|nr:ACP phosphodiesterase [Sporocytophaga myxococcoides]